jgi:hypothetical protein
MQQLRRVKCDEARPGCLRCIKFGLVCDGYPDPAKSTKKLSRPVPEKIMPFLPGGNFPTTSPACRSPQQSIFKNEQEYRYFKVFSNETAYQLSGYLGANLWQRLVLQACERSSSIRHVVIAIGALSFDSWKVPAKSPEEKLRRQFAYHEVSTKEQKAF